MIAKTKWCGYAYFRQNRLHAKKENKRQGWTLYNDKWDNLSGRYKFINTYALKIGAPKYVKQL